MYQKTVGVRLDEETQARLKALGKSRDRSPHYLIKTAIETYLDQEETIEAERLLMRQRWEQYELTGDAVGQVEILRWAKSLPDVAP